MKRTTTLLAAAAALTAATTATGCELVGSIEEPPGDEIVDDVQDDIDDGIDDIDDPVPEDLAAQLEDALFDKLQCEEIVRPSTLNRIRDLLRDPTFDEVEALVTNPQDLATVVSMAGAEVEGAVIVARNLERLLATGAAADLLANGWDGMQCSEPLTAACTAGEQTTTVSCDEGGAASAIDVGFALCTLGGTVHDGAMTLDRVDGVETSARVSFAALAFDEIKVLDGALGVALEGEGLHATLDADEGLAYTEHGGPVPLDEGGVSCGARLALDALALDVDDQAASIAFAGERATLDDTLAIETTAPLRFAAGSTCGCPAPGGGLRVDVPRPLGREGETAAAQIEFVATDDAALCAEARVTLVDWPTTCPLGGDCSKGATEATLGKVLSALCTEL